MCLMITYNLTLKIELQSWIRHLELNKDISFYSKPV